MEFYPVKIKKRVQETEKAATFYFALPSDLQPLFTFTPGQYLTIRVYIGDEEYRRSYSLCTLPGEGWAITVKKISGGKVSPFILTHMEEGEMVEISPPTGTFTVRLKPDEQRDHFFFVTGSGITPVYPMIRQILEEEAKSRVLLLYGNRIRESAIFFEEMEKLEQKYMGQFILQHTFSSEGGLWQKVFSSKAFSGRINPKLIRRFLTKYPAIGTEECYYFCGIGDMIQKGISYLIMEEEVSFDEIHAEYFTQPEKEGEGQMRFEPSTVTITLRGQKIKTEVIPGQDILHHLIDKGYDPPYSCTSGTCSSCKAKLLKGEVRMDSALALEASEIEEGYILTCQSHPVTDRVEISYDNL